MGQPPPESVRSFLERATGLDLARTQLTADIRKDLGISSLEAERIAVLVEVEYRIALDDGARLGVRTLGEFLELVQDTIEFQR